MNLHKKIKLISLLFICYNAAQSQENCDQPYMEIGMGLSGGYYYSSQHVFKDYALNRNVWATTYVGGAFNTKEGDLLSVDSDGYPLSLPQNINGKEMFVRSMLTADGFMPLGNYFLLYEGEAEISFKGALKFVENVSEGKIKFEVVGENNGWIDINTTPLGNHIKAIKVIPEKYIDNFESEPFIPEFIEKIKPYSVLRMMNLMKTNNWDTTKDQFLYDKDEFLRDREWSERVLPTYYTQSGVSQRGMAFEYIISISNYLNKDIWITIPHNVSNDFVKEMAKMFKQTLKPNLKIYLEYSNELWNWQFYQTRWIEEHRENGRFPGAENHSQAAGMRAKEVYNIWMQEYSGLEDQVVRIIGGQSSNPYVGEQWMKVMEDSEWDALAITHYYGIKNAYGETDPNYQFRDRMLALGSDAKITDIVDLAREYHAYLKNKNGGNGYWKGNIINANNHGKPTVTYEGNGHIVSGDNIDDPVLLDLVLRASRSPEMAVFYGEVINDMRDWGMSLLMPFVLAKKPSIWGDWGHYESTFDTEIPPKVQILLDNISPCQLQNTDNDDDNVTNSNDLCSNTPNGESVDANGCSQSQLDDDDEIVDEETIDDGPYPNPFQTEFTIPIGKDEIGKKKLVRLFSISGQILQSLEATVNENGNLKVENLNIPSGTYILMVDRTGFASFYTIIKM